MSTKSRTRAALSGSRMPALTGAARVAADDDRRPLDVTLRLRAKSGQLARAVRHVLDGRRPPFTREEFAGRFGASKRDCAVVERWAARHHVRVMRIDLARRAIDLRAPAGHLARLFGATLVRYRLRGVTWASRAGALTLPRELDRIVLGVFGFDERPLAVRGAPPMATGAAGGHRLSFTPPEIARYYNFPERLDGRGQTVGVIALGGGYRERDLGTFYRHLELRRPTFKNVCVCGASNAPGGPSMMADGEVTGDIETIGAIAPGADIVVYFGPNSGRGFLEAVSRAVHDNRHRPSVISISWGQNEMHWTRRTLRLFDEVLAEAVAMGVTVCCASGDFGAFADLRDRTPHVCFPGSSPYVIACGGTSLRRGRNRRLEETAWRDAQGASGGGMSAVFPRPAWQIGPGFPRVRRGQHGRGVPDVAANGDPESGYRVFVLGRWVVGAGTSAAAPVWAGLVALVNQMRGAPIGLFTPYLYRHRHELVRKGALRPVRKGQSGGPAARHPWNRHTGLGVPHGGKLAGALIDAFRGLMPDVPPRRRPRRRAARR